MNGKNKLLNENVHIEALAHDILFTMYFLNCNTLMTRFQWNMKSKYDRNILNHIKKNYILIM